MGMLGGGQQLHAVAPAMSLFGPLCSMNQAECVEMVFTWLMLTTQCVCVPWKAVDRPGLKPGTLETSLEDGEAQNKM